VLVWGGEGCGTECNSGGRYALRHSIDDDGDGFSECDGDCNDQIPSVFPGAPDACDGTDSDCDGTLEIDSDGDATCAHEDCDDGDPGVARSPIDVEGVRLERPTRVSFVSQDAAAGASTSYDVATGALADLSTPQGFQLASCAGTFDDSPAEISAPDPAPGTGHYFLVRARNSCGTGGWGDGSDGSPRNVTACP
jgi:hypothetical protein